jgi:hypothetical protein
MRFCFVTITKKGHLLLLTFNPIKIKRRKKKKIEKENPKYKRIYKKKA